MSQHLIYVRTQLSGDFGDVEIKEAGSTVLTALIKSESISGCLLLEVSSNGSFNGRIITTNTFLVETGGSRLPLVLCPFHLTHGRKEKI